MSSRARPFLTVLLVVLLIATSPCPGRFVDTVKDLLAGAPPTACSCCGDPVGDDRPAPTPCPCCQTRGGRTDSTRAPEAPGLPDPVLLGRLPCGSAAVLRPPDEPARLRVEEAGTGPPGLAPADTTVLRI